MSIFVLYPTFDEEIIPISAGWCLFIMFGYRNTIFSQHGSWVMSIWCAGQLSKMKIALEKSYFLLWWGMKTSKTHKNVIVCVNKAFFLRSVSQWSSKLVKVIQSLGNLELSKKCKEAKFSSICSFANHQSNLCLVLHLIGSCIVFFSFSCP